MAALRNEVARLDPQLPLYDMRTMLERVDASLATRKLALSLAATFGVVALLLAGLGLYGVLRISSRSGAVRSASVLPWAAQSAPSSSSCSAKGSHSRLPASRLEESARSRWGKS